MRWLCEAATLGLDWERNRRKAKQSLCSVALLENTTVAVPDSLAVEVEDGRDVVAQQQFLYRCQTEEHGERRERVVSNDA